MKTIWLLLCSCTLILQSCGGACSPQKEKEKKEMYDDEEDDNDLNGCPSGTSQKENERSAPEQKPSSEKKQVQASNLPENPAEEVSSVAL